MEGLEPSMIRISSIFGFTKSNVESRVGSSGGGRHFTDDLRGSRAEGVKECA